MNQQGSTATMLSSKAVLIHTILTGKSGCSVDLLQTIQKSWPSSSWLLGTFRMCDQNSESLWAAGQIRLWICRKSTVSSAIDSSTVICSTVAAPKITLRPFKTIFRLKLTFPVHAKVWTEEIVAHFTTSDSFDCVHSFQWVHHHAGYFLLSFVHPHFSVFGKELPATLAHSQSGIMELLQAHFINLEPNAEPLMLRKMFD